MAVTLYKFGAQWGITDPSPFCVKLESFLRLNNIEFTLGDFDIKSTLNKAPKKKMPFVVFEDGRKMGDSTLIINHLSDANSIDMDAPLSAEQRTISYAFRRMLDEGFYFPAVYSRWADDIGWNAVMPIFFDGLPNFLKPLVSGKIRKDVIKMLNGQGTARHSKDEIYTAAERDLQALSNLLGDNQWFLNTDQPTLLEIWTHAFVINCIIPPIETDLKTRSLKFTNLCDHAHRFEKLVYKTASEEQTEAE